MSTLAQLGEFGLIERLEKLLGELGCLPREGLGIGDDAAVVPAPGDHDWLMTTDAQVEDVHFSSRWARPEEVGRRAIAANLSDIGAMGGCPQAVVVSLGLRPDMPIITIEGWYRGLADGLRPWNATVVGGNITAVEGPAFIDITVLGRVLKGQAIRRSGAAPGDAVIVSGFPGEAAAGLRCFEEDGEKARTNAPELAQAYLEPTARVSLGMALAARGLVTAMADTSDGLAADLASICRASGCAAELEASELPLRPALAAYARRVQVETEAAVLGPSDDYQLVFSCRPEKLPEVMGLAEPICPLTHIGSMAKGLDEIYVVSAEGKRKWAPSGWEHFAG